MKDEHKPEKELTRKAVGKLIVFEGPDGSGKTTLCGRVVTHLKEKGLACQFFAFPGNEEGTLGKRIYDLHHAFVKDEVSTIDPTSIQLLHIAAHIDAIENRIMPLLRDGTHIVLDRLWWSTWVYGLVCGANKRSLDSMIEIEQQHWGPILPAIVFLIQPDVPYRDHTVRWEQLAREYSILAEREQHRYLVQVIKNNKTVDNVVRQVFESIDTVVLNFNQRHRLHRTKNTVPISRMTIFSKLAPARPTVVYETFWRFAAERQRIFFARVAGQNSPWTQDPILRSYKFTNAYRASDRVSQYLIKHVIYNGDQSANELFFKTMLFKIFNKIETWELLMSKVGPITYADYSFNRYNSVLSSAIQSGTAIYSCAYIMPSGGSKNTYRWKHTFHLKLLKRMLDDEVPNELSDAPSMAKAFEILRSYPSIGDFLAYQYITDLNYSVLTDFRESDFVVPGPGAKDGIKKCFSDTGGLTEGEIIRVMAENQDRAFEQYGLEFQDLWGRPLQLIDCQNLFCEVDKYARLKHPEIKGYSNRSRIKQRYRMNPDPIEYWYPPKWGLNDRIVVERQREAPGVTRPAEVNKL